MAHLVRTVNVDVLDTAIDCCQWRQLADPARSVDGSHANGMEWVGRLYTIMTSITSWSAVCHGVTMTLFLRPAWHKLNGPNARSAAGAHSSSSRCVSRQPSLAGSSRVGYRPALRSPGDTATMAPETGT
jgi:hypothetical protein